MILGISMDQIHKLTEYFGEFPGIGPRQARRFVYYLLTRNSGHLEEIARLILDIKKNIRLCSSCFRFFPETHGSLCPICSNKNRDISELMIVSRDVDFEAIEKSKIYHGYYFILGGTIPILEKEPEKKVRLKELKSKIDNLIKDSSLKEIILSLNMTAEGENTEEFLKQFVLNNFPNSGIKVSILGRGLSTGSELEYLDSDTIRNALKNRKG